MKNWPLALWSCSLYNPWWFNFFLGLKFWTPAYFNFSLSWIHFLSTEQKFQRQQNKNYQAAGFASNSARLFGCFSCQFQMQPCKPYCLPLRSCHPLRSLYWCLFFFLTTERIPYSNLSIYIAFVIRILGKTCPSFSNLIHIKQLLVYMHVWLSFDCFPHSSNQNTALTTLQQQQQQKVLEQQLLILSNSPFGDSPLFRNSLLVNIQRIK